MHLNIYRRYKYCEPRCAESERTWRDFSKITEYQKACISFYRAFNKYSQDALNISLKNVKKKKRIKLLLNMLGRKKSAIYIFAETIQKSVYMSISEHAQNLSRLLNIYSKCILFIML